MSLLNKYLKTILYIFAPILVMGAFIIQPVLGQVSQFTDTNTDDVKRSITISPLIFELSANPGDSLKNNLKVSNTGNVPILIKMEVEDFTAVGETGSVIVQDREDETFSLSKWVTVKPAEFNILPGQHRVVEFTIAIAPDGEPGGHYGSILVNAAPTEAISGPALAQKAGALVLLSVAGEVNENLLVKEFSAPAFLEKGPVDFTLRFQNNGSVHTRPKGFISITNIFGKKEIDLQIPQKNVLPNSIRKTEATWEPNFAIGRYTATLVANYGIDNSPLQAVVRFWIFPWKIGLVIFFSVLIVLYLLIRSRKRLKLAFKVLFRGDK